MAKTWRKKVRRKYPGRVGRTHGNAWNTMDWYVPFIDNQAAIYHGHEDPNDHSECGPQIFCCPKSARLLLQRHPKGIPAAAKWEFTGGEHLVSWMSETGPQVYYFFFCDPDDNTLLRFIGVYAPGVRGVLLKQTSLDRYLDIADEICTE